MVAAPLILNCGTGFDALADAEKLELPSVCAVLGLEFKRLTGRFDEKYLIEGYCVNSAYIDVYHRSTYLDVHSLCNLVLKGLACIVTIVANDTPGLPFFFKRNRLS